MRGRRVIAAALIVFVPIRNHALGADPFLHYPTGTPARD
jgi:hypothetical protein